MDLASRIWQSQVDQLGGLSHGLLPAFAQRLPYAVAIVELAEGARLISNVIGVDDYESLKIDEALQLTIENRTRSCHSPLQACLKHKLEHHTV
jgi:hypothetical protein